MDKDNCQCQINPKKKLIYGQIYRCDKCEKFVWFSGNNEGELSWLPDLNSETGKIFCSVTGESEFYREIRKKPKIVRLNDLLTFLPKTPRANSDKYKKLKELLLKFGLEIERLYDDGVFLPDESLIFRLQDSRGYKTIMINENNEETPSYNPESKDIYSDQEKLDTNTLAGVLLGNLRVKQKLAITTVMENPGSLTTIALPTGYGKTRIGQFITWLNRKEKKRGPTLLISPLIALMDDQRAQFNKFNKQLEKHNFFPMKNMFLTSVEKTPFLQIKSNLLKDNIDILCCSPDTLLAPVSGNHWIEVFMQMKNPFSTIIIDEAHTIGDWGSSIRPEFQLLGWVKDRLLQKNPDIRVILQSATITENEEQELLRLFMRGLRVNETIREDKLREDISFNIIIENKDSHEAIFSKKWLKFLSKERKKIPARWFREQADRVSQFGKPPLLIYTPTRDFAENQLAKDCIEIICDDNKKLLAKYTGETNPESRDRIRRKFLNDEVKVLVATSAFGMGIDKEDVWSIAYLGMPFTLKGLYQGFGRAARNSRFDESENMWRSGNCLAVIPNRPPRSFKPELGIKKTLERLWAMLYFSEDTIFTNNGYVILPAIPFLNQKASWSPLNRSKKKDSEDKILDEEDKMDISWNLEQALNNFTELKKEERNRNLSLLKRKSALFNFNMWTITCLQRTGRVEFLGLHPKIIKRNKKDKSEIKLVDILENEGYSGLMNSITRKGDWYTPGGQKRMAVIRFRTTIVGHSDIVKLVEEGHRELKKRHDMGMEEMQLFLKNITLPGPSDNPNSCIRKEFAPAIGMKRDDSDTCYELSQEDTNKVVMPCNNCREKIGFSSLLESGFIWSESKNISIIRKKYTVEISKSIEEMNNRELNEIIQNKEYDGILHRKENIFEENIQGEIEYHDSKISLFDIKGKYICHFQIYKKSLVFEETQDWPNGAEAIILLSDKARLVHRDLLGEEE